MQRDIFTAHGGFINYSPTFDRLSDGFDYASLYSIFQPKASLLSAISRSDCSDEDDSTASNWTTSSFATDYGGQTFGLVSHNSPGQYSRFLLEQQDLLDLHDLCLSRIREAAREAQTLRQDNANLQVANFNLKKRLSLLAQAAVENGFAPQSDYATPLPSSSLSPVLHGSRRMSIGDTASNVRRAWDENESPTSMIEKDRVERIGADRVSLPKSISVRSSGYLKTVPPGAAHGVKESRVEAKNRITTVNPANRTGQKVFVPGGKKEEEAIELEVYNQGMSKTELCNKWQMTGSCQYGDKCRFSHGIEELRPVIRHPRYKTQVCRMVLAGDHCTYGHRCHFRHTLTDQERLIMLDR